MSQISKGKISYLLVQQEESGQRLDHYLQKKLKALPNSHLQKIIRSGQVRVNCRRILASYKIQPGDHIRLPPLQLSSTNYTTRPMVKSLPLPVVYEDEGLLVLNKPSGLAVHGGSGISLGVIEQLRQQRPEARYLELVHRLDKETSGLLLVAKKRKVLVSLHEQFRQNHPKKIYLVLSAYPWPSKLRDVKLPLLKIAGQDRLVRVSTKGLYAHTQFELLEQIKQFSLLKVSLKTGRTHQIRVHMQAQQAPIAGDERYGCYELNKKLRKQGLKRMFLHAFRLEFDYPNNAGRLTLEAPMPEALKKFLEQLRLTD
ncbi:MAG: RluA family pseudouridine synthase [Neisseriaceae bacterium]